MKTDIENRRIAVSIECPDAMPQVSIDQQQIKQVYFNLIKNAIEAMPGGGTLTVSTALEQDGQVALRVRDTGAGMEPEVSQRCLEPFYSAKGAWST